MAEYYLPNIRISQRTLDEDIRTLMKVIKPSWSSRNIKHEVIPSGCGLSRLFRCSDVTKPEDVVVIKTELLYNRLKFGDTNENELRMIQYLSETEHFPTIHAIFSNGYCYKFIKGDSLNNFKKNEIFINESLLKSIASELAYVHSLKFEGVKYLNENCCSLLKSVINKIPINTKPSREAMFAEFILISSLLKERKSPVVICHGDMGLANIIWNNKTGQLTFIDWETAGFGYQLMDVAYLFYSLQTTDYYINNSSSEFENKFVRYYLQSLKNFLSNSETLTDEEVHRCLKEIEWFKLEPLLLLASYGLAGLNVTKSSQENGKRSNEGNIKNYLKLKKKLLGKEQLELVS